MIRLYQYEISPFCDKVRRALWYKGQDFEVDNVTVAETLRGRLKKLGPAGKVPVLEIDGERTADSTDIVEMLEHRFPEPALYPDDPMQRALVHVLEDWADESLYFYEVRLRFAEPHNAKRWIPEALKYDSPPVTWLAARLLPGVMSRTADAQGVGRKPKATLEQDLRRHFHAIEQLLVGDWLVGKQLTLADIAVFVQIDCLRGTEEGERLLRECPRTLDWLARVDAATSPSSRP